MLITAIIFLSTLYLINVLWAIHFRLQTVVKFTQLIHSKFYEVFPLRALFWILFGFLGFKFLQSVLSTVSNLFSGNVSFIPSLILTGLLALLLWFLYYKVLLVSSNQTPTINTKGIKISYGIHQVLLKDVGTEKFPNEISPHRHQENSQRKIIATVGICCLAICLLLFLNRENIAINLTVSLSEGFFLFKLVGLIFLLISPCAILILLFNNRDYTFVPFKQTLLIKLYLWISLIMASLFIGYNFYTVCFIGLFFIGCYGLRAIADLRLNARYKKTKKIYNPIVEKIENHVNYLHKIPQDSQLKLPFLKEPAIAERISQGCKNLEEKGILVTRNFAQFLNLVEVEYEEFAIATLRYQTVRRYLSRSSGTGTYRGFQHPKVPIWDLKMFPIKPPQGYVNWIDPLCLPGQWDIVEYCGTCGGTGQVQKTVTETDSEGRTTTRTEYETCSSCNGSGRLEYTQIINTQWQRLLPLVTYPNIPVPEIVEDAEEKILYRLPITENFEPTHEPEEMIDVNHPLVQQMSNSGQQLKNFHNNHQTAVENLYDASLYRADFAIASFRTVLIKFVNLGGSLGWFFGKRPEFYFPRLPLSYSAIITLILLPPIIILCVFLK